MGLGIVLAAGARTVAARPAGFAGSTAVLLLGGTISLNALVGQGMQHPQPMLVTRAPDAMSTGSTAIAPAAPQPWQPTNDSRIMTVPLVREVQELLAQAGYYRAEIDGRPGQATDRAIRMFQAERGLRVDGMATPLLLTQIRQAAGASPAVAEPAGGTQYAGLEDLLSDISPDNSDIPILDEEPADPELVKRIQAGLTNASVAKLTADGIAGSQTRAAIRAFQELEGMEVTGLPSADVLDRLDSIGR